METVAKSTNFVNWLESYGSGSMVMSGQGEIRTRDIYVANVAIYRADLLAHENSRTILVNQMSDI